MLPDLFVYPYFTNSHGLVVVQKHFLGPITNILNVNPPLAWTPFPAHLSLLPRTHGRALCFGHTALLFISRTQPCSPTSCCPLIQRSCNVLPPTFTFEKGIRLPRSHSNSTSFMKPPTRIVSFSSQLLKNFLLCSNGTYDISPDLTAYSKGNIAGLLLLCFLLKQHVYQDAGWWT